MRQALGLTISDLMISELTTPDLIMSTEP